MDAEIKLAEAAARRGISETQIEHAFTDPLPEGGQTGEHSADLLRTLEREVAALGGRLEVRGASPARSSPAGSPAQGGEPLHVRAVFPDETVTILDERELK